MVFVSMSSAILLILLAGTSGAIKNPRILEQLKAPKKITGVGNQDLNYLEHEKNLSPQELLGFRFPEPSDHVVLHNQSLDPKANIASISNSEEETANMSNEKEMLETTKSEPDSCTICLNKIKLGNTNQIVPWEGHGHKYHQRCIQPILDVKESRPQCGQSFSRKMLSQQSFSRTDDANNVIACMYLVGFICLVGTMILDVLFGDRSLRKPLCPC